LASAVNWTSLLINGFVNFIIPLAIFVYAERRYRQALSDAVAGKLVYGEDQIDEDTAGDGSDAEDAIDAVMAATRRRQARANALAAHEHGGDGDVDHHRSDDGVSHSRFQPLPSWRWLNPVAFALALIVITAFLIVFCVVLDVELSAWDFSHRPPRSVRFLASSR
jgi:hypothetical protein